MDIQALMDGMSAKMMRERAQTQMTLGKLIAVLEAMPTDADVTGLDAPHSYRGYYSDLAFEPIAGTVKSGNLLALCKASMGQVFEGYKGGDYVMGALTPVWVANYGDCGRKLMALNPVNGQIETAEDNYE